MRVFCGTLRLCNRTLTDWLSNTNQVRTGGVGSSHRKPAFLTCAQIQSHFITIWKELKSLSVIVKSACQDLTLRSSEQDGQAEAHLRLEMRKLSTYMIAASALTSLSVAVGLHAYLLNLLAVILVDTQDADTAHW